ncbi:MAG: response regulator transcription factor [Chloroflexi bacterium]|jgi:DNA-binding response OmpR family regulator|nr:response regulator transcription factor [Chloroflexota bacterium]
MSYSILVVDSELPYLDLLEANLRAEGYEVFTAQSGEEALKILHEHPVHLVLLDILLPDEDGFTLCRRIRSFSDAGLIILTTQNREEDRVRGLNAGADDYVVKPFSIIELLARIRAVLRRTGSRQPSMPSVIEYNDLKIDLGRAEVSKRGVPISLSATEYRLLLQFVLHRGKVLSGTWLLQNVWGADYDDQERELLWVTIARLRQKLEDDPRHPRYILTRPGEGYWMPV